MQLYVYGRRRADQPEAEDQAEIDSADPACGATTIARWTELLEALGFIQVREVAKQRRTAVVRHEGADVEVSLDSVAGLGGFVEFEERVSADDVPAARGRIESLARDLGCTVPERRSYLELLLEAG